MFLFLALFAAMLQTPTTPRPAVAKMLHLFQSLTDAQHRKDSGQAPPHVAFEMTESEVNDYLIYMQSATPRPGLDSITVKLFPANYYSTYTIIDFEAVEKWKAGTIPTLLKPILAGKKAIWIDFRVNIKDAAMTFAIEKAYFGQIWLPAFFVQKLIQIVAARQAEHWDTTKPVPLPFGLRNITTAEHVVSGEN